MLIDDPASTQDQTQVPAGETVQQPQADDVPEKYKGKSVKDIISMHENAERELGRSRNEIGTQRRLLDEVLGLRRATAQSSPPAPVVPVSTQQLIENPEETITQVATRVADQRVGQQGERLAHLESLVQTDNLRKKHGSYEDVLMSPDFQDWARKSPYRIGLITKAAQGSFEASDEVLSLYSEITEARKPATATTTTQTKDPNLDAARAAATVKSGGSGVNRVVDTSGQGKQRFSRKVLAQMYTNEPHRYAELADSGVLEQAYADKRIDP